MTERRVRLVMPHQLFLDHLDAEPDTVFVLVEHDLLFRQYHFHVQKLVLHRATMRRFADRLGEAGFEVHTIESDGRRTSRHALAALLEELGASTVSVYDVVDDWLARDLTGALEDAGIELRPADVLETPNFLTSREQLTSYFSGGSARMQHFYSWQRERLDVLMTRGKPVGGRWSFDTENRKKLPRNHPVPEVTWPERHEYVDEAIAWARRRFPQAPGNADSFAWPTSHEEAEAGYEQFLAERLDEFGPYEDALTTRSRVVFHAAITPSLNIGLLSPEHVLRRALEVGEERDVPMASLEGFVRQVIGWREYMRATYHLYGRRMRSQNRLEHSRPLADGWWTAETGLEPVDHVLERVLDTGWAHHIERLMVLGNAMCLMRTDPQAAYEWFMEMFVDAYDWVMVPNVYAMSQFAAGEAITTKPYVSGSNYLRKMSDYESGEWTRKWDGLYWTFVRDHLEVFDANPRSRIISKLFTSMDADTRKSHLGYARKWLV